MAAYRLLSRIAAVTAAAAAPPASRIPAAANWAEPAKVVPDITTAASGPISADRANTPNEMPKAITAGANGRTARTPAPIPRRSATRSLSPDHPLA
jgi:hypothetical protein